MKYIRLHNNTVQEIIPLTSMEDIIKYYGGGQETDFTRACMEAPDEVDQRWVYGPDTGQFSPPPPPPLPAYEDLVQQYIHERYSYDDEMKLTNEALTALANGETPSQEYLDYRAYVDACKERAREEAQ